MDLLNISYTESSVLTEGEMSFTLYENTNMANTRYMYCYGKCSKISNTLKLRTPKIITENNF